MIIDTILCEIITIISDLGTIKYDVFLLEVSYSRKKRKNVIL